MPLYTFSNVVPSCSQAPGKIHGLTQVHKENTALRHVSMIRTAEYNLAKYIVKMIIDDAMSTTYKLNSTGSTTWYVTKNLKMTITK